MREGIPCRRSIRNKTNKPQIPTASQYKGQRHEVELALGCKSGHWGLAHFAPVLLGGVRQVPQADPHLFYLQNQVLSTSNETPSILSNSDFP